MPETITITAVTMRDENNEVVRTLREKGYALAIHPKMTPPTREEQGPLLAESAGIIAGPEPITREAMAAAPKLRVISRNGVGYDAVDLDAATDLGIVVTFVPDAMVESVADLTLGLMLAVARKIPELDAATKAGEWRRILASDLNGATLGILGTGRIGMAVARRARAFKMRLVGYDPYPNPLFTEELGGDYLPLDEVLEVADFITLHLPATAGTRGLIGEAQLAKMKPAAFLINAARGSIVDEAALLKALQEGKLAGAGLDVYSQEPPVPGSAASELTKLPNVVAMPHIASYTPKTMARMGRAAMENLLTALSGERPACVANPEVYERGARGR